MSLFRSAGGDLLSSLRRNAVNHSIFANRNTVLNQSRSINYATEYKRVEIIQGKKSKQRAFNVPRIPMHPIFDQSANLNMFLSYRDLKLRWKRSTIFSNNTANIARKWKPVRAVRPYARPTSSFIHHSVLPHHDAQVPMEKVMPPEGELPKLSYAIFKSSISHQHKVTVGDLVQVEKLPRRQAGEKVIFGTVLMAGTKEWTAIGKPTLQNMRVHCTVEQQTLTRDLISFKFKPRKKQSHYYRLKQWVTMLRVDRIEWVRPDSEDINRTFKPVTMLDMYANRWLYESELQFANPEAADKLYDSSIEPAPGVFMKNSLTEEHRSYPDPMAPKIKIRSN